MFKRLSLIAMLGLAFGLLLVACSRTAIGPTSLATPTVGTVVPAVATGMGNVQMIGTTQMNGTLTAFAQTQMVSTPVPGSTQATSTVMPNGTLISTSLANLPSTTPAILTTPIIIVPTSTPGHPSSYVLKSGEFLYCIARRFNVNPDDLMALNGLTAGQILQPGTSLNIPQTGVFPGTRALHPHPGSYTVTSSEETVNSVACYFGDVDPIQIIAANSLVAPYTLHINQRLTIP
jgi:LysM repeat protein